LDTFRRVNGVSVSNLVVEAQPPWTVCLGIVDPWVRCLRDFCVSRETRQIAGRSRSEIERLVCLERFHERLRVTYGDDCGVSELCIQDLEDHLFVLGIESCSRLIKD